MSKKGRSATRHRAGFFSAIKNAVLVRFLRVSREGPEGDSDELETPASWNVLQKGIAIGAALGGAGLVPGVVAYGAEALEGSQMAMERTLENEVSSIVSLDVEEKEELKAEEAPFFVEGKTVEENDSVWFSEPEVSEDALYASTSASLSVSVSASMSFSGSASMSVAASASVSSSLVASELGSVSMSSSESMSVSASESAWDSESLSLSLSDSVSSSASELAAETAVDSEEEESAAEPEYDEDYVEEYYDEVYEDEDWEDPAEILEGLWEGFLEEETDIVPREEEAKEEEVDLGSESLSASLSASMAASERGSMFTSIAVAASELQAEGVSHAARLESQYGLTDFTALANAVANENTAVRRNLSASFTYDQGGSENMASILEARSEDMNAFSSESKAISESMSARESEAARAYFLLVQAMGEASPAEIL